MLILTEFDDFDALKRYLVKPEHVDVLTKVRKMSAKKEAVDFEYNE